MFKPDVVTFNEPKVFCLLQVNYWVAFFDEIFYEDFSAICRSVVYKYDLKAFFRVVAVEDVGEATHSVLVIVVTAYDDA